MRKFIGENSFQGKQNSLSSKGVVAPCRTGVPRCLAGLELQEVEGTVGPGMPGLPGCVFGPVAPGSLFGGLRQAASST